jgi:signal recognition particle receptor subunit alpha
VRKTVDEMLDYVSIFTKTGVVLWSRTMAKLKGSVHPVNVLIQDVLLEEKGGSSRAHNLDQCVVTAVYALIAPHSIAYSGARWRGAPPPICQCHTCFVATCAGHESATLRSCASEADRVAPRAPPLLSAPTIGSGRSTRALRRRLVVAAAVRPLAFDQTKRATMY